MTVSIRSGLSAQPPIVVEVTPRADGVILSSEVGSVTIVTSHPETGNSDNVVDYVAWYFLPVAMRLNRHLQIDGAGSQTTVRNFHRLSQIWQSWLPGHFYDVSVTFAREAAAPTLVLSSQTDLVFYSGGLDAAHCALERQRLGKTQHLMTIHGMDYTIEDDARFQALLNKTGQFASAISDTRIILRSDIYALYDRLGVNLDGHHLAHIFSLAGAGFFYSNAYRNLVLAADEPLEGQFMVFPWGSNSATNSLFDDGQTRLVTACEGVTRIEKLRAVLGSELATQSLSFCWNRKIQPSNCGVCYKCIRTKMLALADSGRVPNLFLDATIPQNWARSFDERQRSGFYMLQEILCAAKDANNTHLLPRFEETQRRMFRYHARLRERDAVKVRLLQRTGLKDFFRTVRSVIFDRPWIKR